jgi:hypothetical protein
MLRRIIKVSIEDGIAQMTLARDTNLQSEMRDLAAVERFETCSSVANRQCVRESHVTKEHLASRYEGT